MNDYMEDYIGKLEIATCESAEYINNVLINIEKRINKEVKIINKLEEILNIEIQNKKLNLKDVIDLLSVNWINFSEEEKVELGLVVGGLFNLSKVLTIMSIECDYRLKN